MKRPQGNKAIYVLNYEECRKLIDQMRFNADSDLFGHEKDDSFKGSIGNIYQSFSGEDVYPSLVSVTATNASQQLCSSISWTGTASSTMNTATNE